MPSPFPGMNPYLERESVWHDFHENFLPVAREILSAQVLPRYFVKIDEHIYVHELGQEERRLAGCGDLWVAPLAPQRGSGAVAALLEAPGEVGVPEIDVEGRSFLEIRDRESRQLISVIELLSPSNKYSGPDREQYLAKTRQLLRSNAHFVEIDLLRGGPPMP